MTQHTTYDALIIGSGQAGGPLSTALANAGWKTALIEQEHIGGTCIIFTRAWIFKSRLFFCVL